MVQKGFYYDSVICTACKACQIACKDKNDLKVGELFRKVYEYESGMHPNVWGYSLSLACNHCEDPKCVKGCPTKALHKLENGIVDHDKNKCIGCRFCTWNCPYGAPQFREEIGKVGKCDMCKDLIANGENPACIDACPMRAIEYGELEELKAKYGNESVNELPTLPLASITSPALLIKPKALAKQKDIQVKEV